jgi:type IV pilus assembly protein PilX
MTMQTKMTGSRGSVLIVSLVILLVLTLLGIAGVDTTMMQERMAGNLQEGVSSFQAAEAGLRDGELDARENLSLTTVFKPACTDGLCEPADPATDSYDVWVPASSLVVWHPNDATQDTNTRGYGVFTSTITSISTFNEVNRQPAYIVERLSVVERGGSIVVGLSNQPQSEWYRVTAKGFGRHGQAQSTLQSVIRK